MLGFCFIGNWAIGQETMHQVTVDSTTNGSISIEPPLPEDGRVPAGTKLKLTATPSDDYAVDSVYYSVPGRWGAMYHESLTGEFEVVVDQDKHLGASFIKSDEVDHVQVTHNVVYAQPGKKPLKYDVYSPTDAKRLPIIVIIHGGGWSTNDEDIMRGLARELTKGGKFVVASLDYRWIGDADGDDAPNSMADLIEDVFGGIAHIVEHAESYGGDPNRVGVTGDSAGGHLSAAASLLIDRIGDGGFGVEPGVFQFKPIYLPDGKTSVDIRQQLSTSIRAAAPSYGVFSSEGLGRFVQDLGDQASEAVAPQDNIPQASTRKVPQYLLRGTNDFLIRHEGVEAFVQTLEAKSQEAIYEQVDGAGHAFFDWKPNEQVKATFDKYGVPYAKKMRDFFEEYLYGAQDTSASAQESKPVVFTTQQDHQDMLDQLGITKLRPGRNSDANAPNGANYDEAQANPYPQLPEVLVTTAGEEVTTPEQWNETRRPELVRMLETHLYGRIPVTVPDVKWEVVETREVEAGGKPAIQKHIIGKVDNTACPEIEVNISMSLTLPRDAKGSVPVLITFGWTPFDPNPFARFIQHDGDDGPRPPSKRDLLIAAGWGCAMINPSTIQEDVGGWQSRRFQPEDAEPAGVGLTRGIIGLTNLGQPRQPDQWGSLRAWGWGASRALDYFEQVPEVDATRVGIAGVSRYGKAALVTMAFDERFAMGLIASSGAGGTALHRRNFGESLENLASSGAYHWMCGNYLQYAAEESSFGRKTPGDLPVDSHMMLALCAPRLTFISHGIPERGDAHWLDHQGSFMAAVAAQPVYRLLGAKDLGRSDDYLNEQMPEVNVDLLDGAVAWRQHDGGHTDGPNVEHFIRWAKSQWATKPRVEKPQAGVDDTTKRSLKEAVGDRFKLGVGVSHRILTNEGDAALIRKHFSILTPENCMKPQGIHPAEDEWNFDATDGFIDFARENRLEVVGHCLVWAKDDRTDPWMMEEDNRPVSRQSLLRRIETHVKTVVSRYGDAVTMWDVVNEAIGDTDGDLLRESVYSRTTGIDFIVTAFKAARAAAPDALLIYNDYNGHKPGKREKLIELLTKLKAAGAPVDAYGMQGHFELGDDSLPQLRETFDALRDLGLKVVVSELDIDVVKRGRWWAEDGKYRDELKSFDPYKDGLPAEIEQQTIDQYVALFQLFDEYSDVIARVSFWNLHDGQSWLNYFPWDRTNYPLLFDRDRQPKPAFDAVYELLNERESKNSNKTSSHDPWRPDDENSREAHRQLAAKTKQGKIDVYFQGDSITRRWAATDYPKLLSHWKKSFHGWNAANFAWGGDNTHHILWRMQNGELDGVSPKVLCLQAGANNLPWVGPANQSHVEDVVEGIQAIIGEFRGRFPDVPIVLTAMFPRDQNPALVDAIDAVNQKLQAISEADERIHWININKKLIDSEGKLLPNVSSDGIHLEEAGYQVWAAALRPALTQILGPASQIDHAPPPTGNPGL
ncbi:Glycoside hydrolase, family 10 [Rhodopirellula europaea 6C]|uniref:Beta-xylanase n=2 Tax=Rhodopirellula TaxID=265488 RepID=M2A832_9BACT|nr:Glycoside hydrolase, family 10 [Rhodopirellula europaea 6C]